MSDDVGGIHPSKGASENPRAAEGKVDRRDFVSIVSSITMAGGMLAGYGTLAAFAGRYLFQNNDDTAWLFVAPVAHVPPGESFPFESPVGVRVVITRRSAAAEQREPTEADFLALSSVCPHLGCRVHWESQNNRFFCPCHNGAFDADGKPIAGPPLAAGQSLPRYPLRVDRGLLFIRMPIRSIVEFHRGPHELIALDDSPRPDCGGPLASQGDS